MKIIENPFIRMIAVCISIFGLAALALTSFVKNPRDDTDAKDRVSGMRPYVDNKTGCQYLGTSSGLTPRLDRDGKPMCGGAR